MLQYVSYVQIYCSVLLPMMNCSSCISLFKRFNLLAEMVLEDYVE